MPQVQTTCVDQVWNINVPSEYLSIGAGCCVAEKLRDVTENPVSFGSLCPVDIDTYGNVLVVVVVMHGMEVVELLGGCWPLDD